jgi:hypothetical protein
MTKVSEFGAGGDVKETSLKSNDVPGDAGKQMLDAARREAEDSASAKASADSMVQAASTKATEIRGKAKAKVDEIASRATADRATGMDKAKASLKTATEAKTKALTDARGRLQAALQDLKSASTNDQIIKGNEKADVACHDAVNLAKKTMDELQTMVNNVQKEANLALAVSDKAGDEIENKVTATTNELEALADQVAEVGLTVSAKMQAKTDANDIALHTSKVAEEIKTVAHEFSEDAKQIASSTRTKGQETSDKLMSEANDAKAEGDRTATRLAETAQSALEGLASAKATWVNAGVDAMGAMSKIISPTDASEATQHESPSPVAEAPWYTRWILGLFGFSILSVTGVLLFGNYAMKTSAS